MKKLKTLLSLIVFTLLLGASTTSSIYAQAAGDSDAANPPATATSKVGQDDMMGTKGWLFLGGIIAAGLIGLLIVRMQKKSDDGEGGDNSINNPAGAI